MTNNLKSLWDKAHNRARERNTYIGLLGKHNPDTTTTLEVAGRADYLWVTLENKTVTQARNEAGVPQTVDLPIKLRLDHGTFIIEARATSGALATPTPTPPSGVLAHTLDEHSDVVITSPTTNEVLKYDGTNWVNDTGGGGAVDSVNGFTGVVVLDPDDLDDTATTNKFTTAAEITKLAGIEALADVTDAGNVGSAINSASTDDTIDDTDTFGYTTGSTLKKSAWSNLKSLLTTVFNAVYAPIAKGVTNGDSHDHNGGDGAQIDHGGLAGLSDNDHPQYGLIASANTWTNNNSIESVATTGNSLAVLRNLAAASTNAPMVAFVQDNAGDDQPAFIVQQDGTGDILSLFDGATEVLDVKDGGSVTITQIGVSNNALKVIRDLAAASTAAALADFIQDNAGDDQDVLRLQQDGSGDLLKMFSGASQVAAFDNAGNLGVGVAPNSTLAIYLSAATGRIRMDSTGNGQTVGFVMSALGASGTQRIGGFYWQAHETSALSFFGITADNSTFALRVYRDNKVGVNIAPTTALGMQAGTSSNDAAVGGVLYVNTTVVGNVGGGTDDLMSYSVPANTLAVNGQSIEYEAAGTCTSGCTLNVVYGSTTIVTKIAAATGDYVVRARIIRTGAATQKCWAEIQFAGAAYDGAMNYVTAAETLSGAVTAKLTAVGTSNNDVVQEMFIVSFADNNT